MIQAQQTHETVSGVNVQSQRWLHLCNGLDLARDGGMVPSILGMTGAMAALGEDISIVTPTPSRLEGTRLPPGLILKGPETPIDSAVQQADVVHIHGLWQAHGRRGGIQARRTGTPYLIAAHGMAEPWALRHKRWKKYLYLMLLERRNLRRASCLHAVSRPEIGHLRQLAPWVPIAYIPNGVDLRVFDDLPDRRLLEWAYPELAGKFVLLFFGRVHVKKGLDLLARAFQHTAQDFPELHILIAGNDDGAWETFKRDVESAQLRNRVTYIGHVEREKAKSVWVRADAFVLPSYSEGFSMAILEALACRLPCLVTTSCHFPELSTAQGGLVVPPTEDGITGGLRQLLQMPADERIQMGRQGRKLVEDHYTWELQARRLVSVYKWLTGQGGQPDCVIP